MSGEVPFKEKIRTLSFASVKHKGEVREIDASQVRPAREPSWEKGVAGERRPDGSFMPVLSDNGAPMGIHEAQSRRSEIEEFKRKRASGAPMTG